MIKEPNQMVVYVDLQAYLSIVGGRNFCRNVERVRFGSLITDSGEKLGGPYHLYSLHAERRALATRKRY